MSLFLNGIEIDGAPATLASAADWDYFDPRAVESLEISSGGIEGPLHPKLASAIGIVKAHRSSDSTQAAASRLFGPVDLWIDQQHGLNWTKLDTIAKAIVAGNPRALTGLKQKLESGYIAEMKMAMELAVAPDSLDIAKRNEALLRLRDLELKFGDYRKDPKTVSEEKKSERIKIYLEAVAPLIAFKAEGILLDTLFDLVQLHEFLNHEARVLESFKGSLTPGLLTDLLCNDLGTVPLEGPCHPMAILAAHLGTKIGLPLKSFFSEQHVCLFVDIGGGFLYEPTAIKMIFAPDDIYTHCLRAPEGEKPRGMDLLVLCLPWDEVFLMSDADRAIAYLSYLTRHVDPRLWVLWISLASSLGEIGEFEKADLMVKKGLKIFPDSMPLLFRQIQILLTLEKEEEALEVFKRLRRVFNLRLERGYLAKPSEKDHRKFADCVRVFGESS